MRHKKFRYRLNRFTSWRKATLKSMVRNLLTCQSIVTTAQKAKAAKAQADSLINLAKEDTLVNRRQAFKLLGEHKMVALLFEDIAKRFDGRTGGFTRIINLRKRRGDDAPIVILELTEIKKKEKKKKPLPSKPSEEKKTKTEEGPKEKPTLTKKPTRSFFGGLRKIFKKERDSL